MAVINNMPKHLWVNYLQQALIQVYWWLLVSGAMSSAREIKIKHHSCHWKTQFAPMKSLRNPQIYWPQGSLDSKELGLRYFSANIN